MTKRSEAKYKIDRRMGQNIWGRPKSPVNKREYGPGSTASAAKESSQDFGTQLRAKQKLKGYYANISERQFHAIYVEASRLKGDSGENLIGLLERRLDTVVYRAKFVATMFAARQFINHGHIKVNGKRVNIASFKVKVGDVIEVKEASKQLAFVTRSQPASRARHARLSRGRSRQAGCQGRARSGSLGSAVPGSDGTASHHRILFALIVSAGHTNAKAAPFGRPFSLHGRITTLVMPGWVRPVRNPQQADGDPHHLRLSLCSGPR